MFTMGIHFLFLNFMVYFITDVKPEFVHDLLSASEHETHLNEDLAKLLEIEYERQGSCDSSVTSTCCTSCAYDGTCYYGGYCCESSKVRTKMLKFGENECPNSWQSDCKLTKLIPIEGCDKSTKRRQHHKIEASRESDSSSSEDRSGLQVMCLCLQTKRCCSGYLPTTPTTNATTYLTETSTVPAVAPYVETTSFPWWFATSTSAFVARTSVAPATTTSSTPEIMTSSAPASTTSSAPSTTTSTAPAIRTSSAPASTTATTSRATTTTTA